MSMFKDELAELEYRNKRISYSNSRYFKGERLLEVLGLKSIDEVYLHIIEIMSCLRTVRPSPEESRELAAAKHRIFWKTMKEIASQEERKLCTGEEEFNIPLHKVREAFPDYTMRTDGRMWLPMHFAMSVPDISVADIDLLHSASDSGNIRRIATDLDKFTPAHLAVMRKSPDIALIRQLKVYDPSFGSCLSADWSTPLHVAAKFSSSVEVIQELIEVQPLALEMYDTLNRIPLFAVSANLNPNAADILQVFIDSNTATIEDLAEDDVVPFDRFFTARKQGSLVRDEMVLKLVEAFPDSIHLSTGDLRLINVAAISLTLPAFKRIAEMDLNQLRWMPESEGGSALYSAAWVCGATDIVRYIHSVEPKLLLSVTPNKQTLLHVMIRTFGCCTHAIKFFEEMRSLAPQAVGMEDNDGNNLLHAFCQRLEESGREDMSMENLKYLLQIVPDQLLATMNAQSKTPYDIISTGEGHPDHYRTRARRLLLQGACDWGLCTDTLQQLNYEARKLALFAFYGLRVEGSWDVCSRILNGLGGAALMREILSFF